MAAIISTSYFSSQPHLPASSATATTSISKGRQPRRHRTGSCVMLEAASGGGAVGRRTRSLMEEDLEELKGCLDLGFGFSYHEIPDLCGTLPGLELCYSMMRRFLDEQRTVVGQLEPSAVAPPPIPDWKISGPGLEENARTCQEMADLVRRTSLGKNGDVSSEHLLHPGSSFPNYDRVAAVEKGTESALNHSLLLSRLKLNGALKPEDPSFQISPLRSPRASTCKTTMLSPVTPLELDASSVIPWKKLKSVPAVTVEGAMPLEST